MQRIAKPLLGAAEFLGKLLAVVASCCLVTMVVITSLNIILRRPPFETPVTGAHELTAFFGALVISLSLPISQLRDRNIRVEIITILLPRFVRNLIDRFVLLVSGALCVVIAWRLFEQAQVLRSRSEVSMTLAIPYFPFIIVVGGCFAVLAIVLFIQTIVPRQEVSE